VTERATRRISPLPATAGAPRRRVFVRGLLLDAAIGAYPEEMGRTQKVRVDLELDVTEPADPGADDLANVVCYDRMTQGVKAILAEGHIRLVETFAERIAAMALAHPMVLAARVRVEKLEAMADAEGVGVEIERAKG